MLENSNGLSGNGFGLVEKRLELWMKKFHCQHLSTASTVVLNSSVRLFSVSTTDDFYFISVATRAGAGHSYSTVFPLYGH